MVVIIIQSAVKNLRKDLAFVKNELGIEGASVDKSQLLPGYTTLTYADYELIYESLKREILEELDGRNQGPE